MKRRILFGIIAAVLLLSLVACGNKKPYTITFSDGSVVELSGKEIKEDSKNEALFSKKYAGAQISFTGKVSSIDYGVRYGINAATTYDIIHFSAPSSVELSIVHGSHDDILLNIKAGDKLKVTSRIKRFFVNLEIEDIQEETIKTATGFRWDDKDMSKIEIAN